MMLHTLISNFNLTALAKVSNTSKTHCKKAVTARMTDAPRGDIKMPRVAVARFLLRQDSTNVQIKGT